jgi:protein TonB
VYSIMTKLSLLMSALFAAAVTFGLFLFMHKLISSGSDKRVELNAIAGIHFGQVEIADEIATKSRKIPKKPPPPKDPPPPPKMQISKVDAPVQNMPKMNIPSLDVPMVGGEGMYIGNFQQMERTAEGDIIPIQIIRPMYPREAAMDGIEGWVKVEFLITPAGTVKDARVLDADPPRIFNRAAVRAVLKWKFKPRVEGGVAVERKATQIIDFTLRDREG